MTVLEILMGLLFIGMVVTDTIDYKQKERRYKQQDKFNSEKLGLLEKEIFLLKEQNSVLRREIYLIISSVRRGDSFDVSLVSSYMETLEEMEEMLDEMDDE